MNASGFPLADLALSFGALLGLWALDRVLRAAGPEDPLIRRFRFGLLAVMLVYAGRVVSLATGFMGLRAIEYLGAGLIPLAVLLLTEGLLRRHAPVMAKTLIGVGTVIGVVLALLPSALVDPGRILFLLAFQVGTFLLAGWLVLSRDRAGLSRAENRAAERLALSLLVILPLGALDFLILVFDLPIQPSGLAVLVLCWLAIGLRREGETTHRAPLLTLAIMVGCALVATGIIGRTGGLERELVIMAAAVILIAVLLSAVLTDAQSALREAEAPSILSRLTDHETRDPVAFFRALAGHPAVDGAVFVTARNLSNLDAKTLARLFAAQPVLRRRAGAQAETELVEPDLVDLRSYLFERYDATHILQVRAEPRLLLALSLPTIGTGTRIEAELEVAQRMAALMETGDGS